MYTATHAGECCKLYSSISADTTLADEYPPYAAGVVHEDRRRRPRRIQVFGAGDLVIQDQWAVDAGSGTTVTIPVTGGTVLDISPAVLKSSTTATDILVIW